MLVCDVPFLGCLFRAGNKFLDITFGKITSGHTFWDVILENDIFKSIDFDEIYHPPI